MTQDISFYTRIITSSLLSGSFKDLEESTMKASYGK